MIGACAVVGGIQQVVIPVVTNTSELDLTESWAPQSCTLPTVEQPLRVAEFDQLFARTVRGVDRPEPGRVRLELEPTAEVPGGQVDVLNALSARAEAGMS